MATIQVIQGFQKIKDSYQIINTNDQAINNQLGFHISGVADRHSANAVVFTPITNISATDVQGAIAQVNERVSNIIASSGTSSTEVVDARLSATYGSFVTLKSRLDNADTRIENTEKPEQQTLNLTELSQIQSVTDSYNGIAETEVGGATLNQVVVNGDFSSGTTGWTLAGSPTINTTDFVTPPQSINIGGSAAVSKTLNYPTGTKLFLSAYGKVSTGIPVVSFQGINVLTGTTNGWSGTTGWVKRYAIVTFDANLANKKIEALGTAFPALVDDIMLIPITGTPYESYTADQMNALVNTYWEGLRSTQSVELGSRGRNLFDGQLESGSITTGGSLIVDATRTRSKNFARVKPNTQYRFNPNVETVFLFDKNKNYLTAVSGSTTFTTTGASFIKFRLVNTNLDLQIMLNEGSTALPYQPFQGSTAKITYTDPTKFDGVLLPNLVRNSTAYKDGKWASVKRVQRYVLQSADVSSIIQLTNIDLITFSNFLPNMFGYGLDDAIGAKISTDKTTPRNNATVDSVTSIWLHYFSTANNSFRIIVPKGTYATLAEARTALAGTVIYYELATPLTITESQFAENGITVDGVLTSNNDFTEFVVQDYDLFAPTSVTYATNLAKSVENLKESVQGLRVVVNNQNLINLEFDARITLLE
jgi:hypothetical protein